MSMGKVPLLIATVVVLLFVALNSQRDVDPGLGSAGTRMEDGVSGQEAVRSPLSESNHAGPERLSAEAPSADVALAGRATDELAVEVDEEYEQEEAVDALEKGPCSLHLSAQWSDSGEPAATHFVLYRLDAPANRFFGPGDQLQEEGELPKEGLWIRDLAEDTYRVVCFAGGAAAGDLPEFVVRGETTARTLSLARPRTAAAYLRLYEPDGTLIHLAQKVDLNALKAEPSDVPWLAVREQLMGYSTQFTSIGSSASRQTEERAGAAGFPLGELREPRRAGHTVRRVSYTREGDSAAAVTLRWSPGEGTEWSGVLASTTEIVESLSLPSGTPVDPALLVLSASTEAVKSDELPASFPWAAFEVQVRASYPEHAALEFSWRPSDGPPAARVFAR